jgi:hypothetical protein
MCPIQVRDVACRAAVALIPLVDEKSSGKLMAMVQNDLYGRANDRPKDAVYLTQHLAPLLHVKSGDRQVDTTSWDFFYPFFKDAPDNPNVDIRWFEPFPNIIFIPLCTRLAPPAIARLQNLLSLCPLKNFVDDIHITLRPRLSHVCIAVM